MSTGLEVSPYSQNKYWSPSAILQFLPTFYLVFIRKETMFCSQLNICVLKLNIYSFTDDVRNVLYVSRIVVNSAYYDALN